MTKYTVEQDNVKNTPTRRIVRVKRKTVSTNTSHFICQFNDFETFCKLCELLKINNISIRGLIGLSSLYYFKNSYFLVLKNVSVSHKNNSKLTSYITEFGRLINYSEIFENKLKEFGNVIMKKNAISNGIKYFCK